MPMEQDKYKTPYSEQPYVVTGSIFTDGRGSFHEFYNEFAIGTPKGIKGSIQQINISVSKRGTIRGMHLQYRPMQGKFIQVIKGSAIFVELDCMPTSPTYGTAKQFLLHSNENIALWVPFGFANGFQALEDDTTIVYACTGVYNPDTSISINPFSEEILHHWLHDEDGHVIDYTLSEQDATAPMFSMCEEEVGNTVYNAYTIQRTGIRLFDRFDI